MCQIVSIFRQTAGQNFFLKKTQRYGYLKLSITYLFIPNKTENNFTGCLSFTLHHLLTQNNVHFLSLQSQLGHFSNMIDEMKNKSTHLWNIADFQTSYFQL